VPTQLQQLITLGQLRPFRNAYLGRGLAVWVLARLALAWNEILDPGIGAEIALLGVCGIAVWIDAHRRTEHVFLGNLGIPGWTVAALAVPAALLAEMVVP